MPARSGALGAWLSLASVAACTAPRPLPAPVVQPAPLRPSPGARVRFDRTTELGRVLVVDEGDLRYLRFGAVDGDDQSVVSLSDPDAVPMDYIRLAALGLALTPAPRRVLVIGLGGGSFARLVRRLEPDAHIDAVEIDPVVAEVAERFFGLRPDDHLRVHIADGDAFVTGRAGDYDLVFLDAYTAEDVPVHLTTPEHFGRIRDALAPSGVVVLNVSVDERAEARLLGTFEGVFPDAACLRTGDDANVILFARAGPLPANGRLAREVGQRYPLLDEGPASAVRLEAPCPRSVL